MFVGPSRCGKATTLTVINHLVEPTSDTSRIEGRSLEGVPVHELRRGIRVVIQQLGFFPHQSIRQNIAAVPGLIDYDKANLNEHVDERTEPVSLSKLVGMDGEDPELVVSERLREVGIVKKDREQPS